MSGRRIGFLSALRRWWAVIALATGAGGLLGYAYASRANPTYEAETQLVVNARAGDLRSQQAAASLVPTFAELVRSRQLLEPAVARLDFPVSVEELERDVRGEAENDTRLLRLRVRAGQPSEAIALANAIADELVRYVARRSNPPGVASPPTESSVAVDVRVLEPATEAERIRPRTALTMQFGALAALFGTLAACVLVDALRPRIKDVHDLTQVAPDVLGSVNGGHGIGGFAASDGVGPYETLAAKIASTEADGTAGSVLVLGAQAGDGSASVALNLAATMVRGGARVVLLDLGRSREILKLKRLHSEDPWNPIPPARLGGLTLERFQVEPDPQFVVALRPRSGPRTVSQQQVRDLMALLLQDADALVVHAQSLKRSPDALVWARAVERTLLVARRDHTRPQSVTTTLESLQDVRSLVVGTVLHDRRL